MQTVGSVRKVLSGVNLIFVSLAFFCLPVMAHAGGLGIAAVTAIAGAAALMTLPLPKPQDIPLWGKALLLFLAWAFISALWSSYENPNVLSNPLKLVIGVGLFFCFDYGVKAASIRSPKFLRNFVIGVSFAGLCVLLIDLLFPYGVTYLFDPIAEGEHAYYKTGDILMNLGHAVAVYTLLLGLIVGLLRGAGRGGMILISVFIISLLIAAVSHGLAIGVIGVLAALIAMGCAKFWPRGTLSGLTILAVISILAAPLMGFVARVVGPDMEAKLPISWEHRLEMWNYITEKIGQHPFIGHGFDSVRTFGDTYTSRGLEFAYVSLHPHSAGLHIWVETGAVGAVLATITLGLIGKAAISAVKQRPELAVPFAGFASAAVTICAVTFGVWQDWWWAALIMGASMRHLIPRQPKL